MPLTPQERQWQRAGNPGEGTRLSSTLLHTPLQPQPPQCCRALPASLSLCTGLTQIHCSGLASLTSLAGCPPTLRHLTCDGTGVEDLAPLAACPRLRRLSCNATPVTGLAPLAACPELQTLYCGVAKVEDLGPLVACPGLEHLSCLGTRVSYLTPLTSCRKLLSLDCSNTLVSVLAPLSACTQLRMLLCYGTRAVDLAPLAACGHLAELRCDQRVPAQQLVCLLRARERAGGAKLTAEKH